MTTRAVTGETAVIDVDLRPVAGHMTAVTVGIGGDMLRGLTSGGAAVVATRTGTGHSAMIHLSGSPKARNMTAFTDTV